MIKIQYLRATHDLDGADLVVAPSHSLQGGVVIAHLPLLSSHVLTLEKRHTAITLHLFHNGERKTYNLLNALLSENQI